MNAGGTEDAGEVEIGVMGGAAREGIGTVEVGVVDAGALDGVGEVKVEGAEDVQIEVDRVYGANGTSSSSSPLCAAIITRSCQEAV